MNLGLEYISDKIGEDYLLCEKSELEYYRNNDCYKELPYHCEYSKNNKCKRWKMGDCIFINTQTGTGKTFFIINNLIKSILEENLKSHPIDSIYKMNIAQGILRSEHVKNYDSTKNHKKILILCSRKAFKKQFKKDLVKAHLGLIRDYLYDNAESLYSKKHSMYDDFNAKEFTDKTIDSFINDDDKFLGCITVQTYQSISNISYTHHDNIMAYLEKFDYIVLDEYHCMVSDAMFDNEYNFIFNALVKNYFINSIRIFISATPCSNTSYYLKHKFTTKIYSDNRNYNYLNVKYFLKDEIILNFIKDYYKHPAHNNYKWVFFVSSRDKARKFYKDLKKEKIKVSLAMSGLQNKEIENIVENSTFKANVLISTKFLDNGINFKDENIKNLVVMEIDETTFLQEIGRVRFDINNAPMINLYISARNKKIFSNFNTMNEKTQKILDSFNDKKFRTKKPFTYRNSTKYYMLPYYLFYMNPNTGEWYVNDVGEYRFRQVKEFIKETRNSFDSNCDFPFIKMQLSWLGLEDSFKMSNFLNYENYFDDIKNFLIKNVRSELDKEKQIELSKLIIDFENLTNSKTCKSKNLQVETINNFFKNHNLFCEIELKKSSERVEGKKNPVTKRYREINFTYWKIYTCKNISYKLLDAR
ncbi:TPA: DEAD/DEAH box helicase [Clostridioides difficile]|nr:DEAD/DEAH box helicase [Clostridioides difficile]HBG7315945.1 DEAD/DEAH box helicase [Clostridioides difficile]